MLGFQDEVWWSRFARPELHAWTDDSAGPLRLQQSDRERGSDGSASAEPKALACYGLLRGDTGQMLLRFVAGRPVSHVTEEFLPWIGERLAAEGKRALLLVWDNASWHVSRRVRAWIQAHNRRVKAQKHGVRIVSCLLPIKAPWLNRIEPKWVHGKRAVIEPDRPLSAAEVVQRVYSYYDCEPLPPIQQHLA